MAWKEPKTNWQAADVVSKDDFNRIEGNAQHLKDTKVDETEFNLHKNNKNNPHNVTASQVGAAPSSHSHAAGDLPSASTSAKGIVQLSTSTSSTSTTLAATASAVRTVNNNLSNKVDKPSSATSGNIAVFDGGPGKLKDSGTKIADFLTAACATGTYVGDGTASRNINVGFAPKVVWVFSTNSSYSSSIITSTNGGWRDRGGYINAIGDIPDLKYGALTSTGFKTGSGEIINADDCVYVWIALR